ncbi:MAG: HAD family phosphatase, partial [Candidatus Margulisbacteria bacterium]|nr:HAD family phosphatase [Candidatus Margulisiibacteriota bacterium]
FDIGNVLFGYDPHYILNQLLPENAHHQQYLDHFIHAQVWQDLDRGTVDESALVDMLVNRIDDPNLDDNLHVILQNFIHHLHLIEGSRTIFLALNKTYPMYLLSNFQAVPFSKLREIHPFLYMADGAIISAHHQLMKPEPAIYQKLLKKYQLVPSETVFIDDLPENIAAAKALGMHGIVFQSPDALANELERLGVAV